ncbi:MAG: META domain-containing protein [Aquimonas sp.]|nr:META domain-containing protein [Aquimonas sp.]
MSRLLIPALALVLLAACGGREEAPPASADQTPAVVAADAAEEIDMAKAEPAEAPAAPLAAGESWTLVGSGLPELVPVLAEGNIFIEVQESRVVGYAGCNRFSASMQQPAPGVLKIDAPMASKRACLSEERNAAEQALLFALPQISRQRMVEGRLRLQSADGLWLEFAAGRPESADSES